MGCRSFRKTGALLGALFYRQRMSCFLKAVLGCLLRRPASRSSPFLLQIEPSSRCNLKCGLCPTGRGLLGRLQGDLALDTFKKAIDELEKSIAYLSLYNLGEPLLNSRVFEMIAYARSKNIFVRLSTNGELLNKENREKLLRSGLNELLVSLDCVRADQYKAYKGVDGFDRVVGHVRSLVRERGGETWPFVTLQLLAMKKVEDDIVGFRRLVKSLKVDRGMVKKLRINLPGIPFNKDLLPANTRYVRAFYKNNYKRKYCFRPFFSTTILWDGSIVPCCFDMQGRNILGNINDNTFEHWWHGPRYAGFRSNAVEHIDRIAICNECSLEDISEYFINYM